MQEINRRTENVRQLTFFARTETQYSKRNWQYFETEELCLLSRNTFKVWDLLTGPRSALGDLYEIIWFTNTISANKCTILYIIYFTLNFTPKRFGEIVIVREFTPILRFVEPCIVIYVCNRNQQSAHFLHQCFNLIIVSSALFKHPSLHPREGLYMQFYGISFMHPYN